MSQAVELSSSVEILKERIVNRTAKVGIIGLGYVGLPLAVEFAIAGFDVTGIDVQEEKTSLINRGMSYIQDVQEEVLHSLVQLKKVKATTDFCAIRDLDTINICVPTPLRKTKDPDMSYIVSACEEISGYIRPGQLIILESTTYPGTTNEVLLPMLSRNGLKVGEDFFLCFSPERIDPGNAKYRTGNIPKVVGGVTSTCTEMGRLFYSQALTTVVAVSSTAVAEMVKLLENTFRMINIGLANEMAIICYRMGINVWEVIDAAATKPFGFMPFYPGPGLGGHCIPIDPFYLSWKSKQAGIETRFIELAGYINGQMPRFVVDRIQAALNDRATPLRGSHVHVIGVAYKRDVNDIRESPALDVMHMLRRGGATVTYSDPYVPHIDVDGLNMQSRDVLSTAQTADCCVILTDHSRVDYAALVDCAQMIVDSRNALKGFVSENIVRM
jgi:UDP-N-acetyl-D-glucosamine dehydrogenase